MSSTFTKSIRSSNTASIPQKSESRPIQKIGIIGAGIAGLSLAHALENLCAFDNDSTDDKKMEISVFDSRTKLNLEDGAGIQINGGASVLHKINPNLFQAVAEAGLPLGRIRSRTQSWFPLTALVNFFSLLESKSSNGKESANVVSSTLLDFDIEEIVRKTGGDTEKELIVDQTLMSYSIMRGALQEVLLEELSDETKDRLHFNKRLTSLKRSEQPESEGIICEFEDGSTAGPFDLVVGCDGIQSNVKEFVDKGTISRDNKNIGSSIYSGIRIIFAVQDGDATNTGTSESRPQSVALKQSFGNGGYGLQGIYGAGRNRVPSQSAFFIYRDENYNGPFPKSHKENKESASITESPSENSDWSQNVQSSQNDPKADFLERMKKTSMPSSDLIPVVENANRFFELGVYFHNPFNLNGWKREVKGSGGAFCVLAGDSAHAMPPFLGQGANQAIQDAYCLASKISEHNANQQEEQIRNSVESETKDVKSLKKLLQEYENQRWKVTTSISLKATFLGYLEAGEEGFLSKFRDIFFFFAGKVGLARRIFLDGATPKV